ncbi:hypothetical protein IFM47457_01185 [Aspergillus lentulus]|nr:hypothetical protein IFM47457_01185 [Aspergillus lentulus]
MTVSGFWSQWLGGLPNRDRTSIRNKDLNLGDGVNQVPKERKHIVSSHLFPAADQLPFQLSHAWSLWLPTPSKLHWSIAV